MKLMKVSYSEELLSSGEASSTPYRPRPEQAQSAREGGWLAPVDRSRQRLGAERAGLFYLGLDLFWWALACVAAAPSVPSPRTLAWV